MMPDSNEHNQDRGPGEPPTGKPSGASTGDGRQPPQPVSGETPADLVASNLAEGEGSEGLSGGERQALVPDLLARRFAGDSRSQAQIVWEDFSRNRAAYGAMWVMIGLAVLGIFAPMIANHRPYIMLDRAAGLWDGLSFPLFRFFSIPDWMLLIGFFEVTIGFAVYRRARARAASSGPAAGGAGWLGLGLMGGILAATVACSLAIGDASRLEGQGVRDWALMLVGWIGGLGLVLTSGYALIRNRPDAFGRISVGPRIVRFLFGAMLLITGAAAYGTLGQPQRDLVDYYTAAQRDNVWAVFPPIQHDFVGGNIFQRNQSPGGPRTRVLPSGGSYAAADLGLTDERRNLNLVQLIAEPGTAAAPDDEALDRAADDAEQVADVIEKGEMPPMEDVGADADAPTLTRDTPLAWLRNGNGVRRHGDPRSDFTIVARSLQRFSISLVGAETVGDVLDKINTVTDGVITASIGPNGTRIVLDDITDRRPRHMMGTDGNGMDVLARLIHATRVALSIGFVSTSIALLIGVTVGSLMGYFGGWVDIAGMRVIEIFMAIPRLFLLLTIIAFIPPQYNEHMLYAMMVVIGLTTWMGGARFIRAEFFRLREQDFVQAAKACGIPVRSILFRHMLPNGVTPVLVDASFSIAAAILLETNLSFLGFGIKPPNPSWGQMLSDAVDPQTGVFYWWLAIFPGLMIFVTVFAFNVIGDAMRDAIDPKLKKASH